MEGTARLMVLLDTHIWLWSLQDAKRLGRRVHFELTNSAELWLSPISTWEALTLHATGRIRLHGDLGEWMASATAPFREAPLTHEIARELNLAHQDPTDGFLAATALVLDLTLVTADSELLGLGEIATLANC
jgi:PIN domain nuclease of toxin-antitoxin system